MQIYQLIVTYLLTLITNPGYRLLTIFRCSHSSTPLCLHHSAQCMQYFIWAQVQSGMWFLSSLHGPTGAYLGDFQVQHPKWICSCDKSLKMRKNKPKINRIPKGIQYVLSMMCKYVMVKVGEGKHEKNENRWGIYKFCWNRREYGICIIGSGGNGRPWKPPQSKIPQKFVATLLWLRNHSLVDRGYFACELSVLIILFCLITGFRLCLSYLHWNFRKMNAIWTWSWITFQKRCSALQNVMALTLNRS